MLGIHRQSPRLWRCGERELSLEAPLVMGILNVSPDSFYDGGRYLNFDAAVERARQMADEGASIIDIGGESTRPGADEINVECELERVIPVVREVCRSVDAAVSIDTRHLAVAASAVDAGADIINNIMPVDGDVGMAALAAGSGAGLVVMHMRGTPRTMNTLTNYDDVESDVYNMLRRSVDFVIEHGVDPAQTVVDPGIGFAKESAHNLRLIAHLDRLTSIAPVLLGASRKRFIGEISGTPGAEDRLGGSVAAVLEGVRRGASIVRVHDVRESVQAIALFNALQEIGD